MKNDGILTEQIGESIAKITLNRPEKHNALSVELMEGLCEALKNAEKQNQVVIIDAKGTTFSSGLDLQQAADNSLIEKMASQIAALFTILHDTSLVTIACVQGNAIAGGGGLAAACDIVLLAEEAKIGFPETRRGLIAAQVATILVRQLSMRNVRELLLTGQMIDSYRAVEMGLANYVVIQEDIDKEALRIAREILKGAPSAIVETKRLLGKLEAGNFPKDLDLALTFHYAARNSFEGKEGIASFLEKRPSNWSH